MEAKPGYSPKQMRRDRILGKGKFLDQNVMSDENEQGGYGNF